MSNALAGRTEGQEGQVLIAALGVAAGFSSSFLGIGGGLLLVPVLTGFLRCPIERAVGTSLATVVFISLAGVLAEWEVNGAHIRWTWALVLGAGSLVGTALGARIIARIPDAPIVGVVSRRKAQEVLLRRDDFEAEVPPLIEVLDVDGLIEAQAEYRGRL